MKATEAKMLAFLDRSPQFEVPIYQRTYSWTSKECEQLWNDVVRAGRDDSLTPHFVGSIVYIEKGLYSVSTRTPMLVIDGQQRLTTVTLLIEALARSLGDAEPVEGFSARKLRNWYLFNPDEDGEARYKLLLSQTDRDTLIALLDQQPLPKDHSLRVQANLALFCAKLAAPGADVAALCKGLAKLVMVDISLNREHDNPQLIFESLNSTGLELSQADLIRNFVLMRLEPQEQTSLYRNYWHPVELNFGQRSYATHFDGFMRHFLTVRTGEIHKIGEVYAAFKQYAGSPTVAAAGTEALLADIAAFADHYCAMAFGKEPDPDLAAAFQDLHELKVDVAYPLLLELYSDHVAGMLTKTEFLQILRWVESYVFRRSVCAIPTNTMNRMFAGFARKLRKDRYLESVQAELLLLPSYRRFPGDEEFERDIRVRDLYSFRSRSYWLRRMENHGRRERVPVDEFTIEHIMPQNENLSLAWQADLGPEWERIQETWLHTLGNLTLTGYNSQLSDRPFLAKRDLTGGFADSPLRMNAGLGRLEKWDEPAIRARAATLATKATTVWAAPAADAATLDAYRPRATQVGSYSIHDHPSLAGPMREIYEALRREVLALDPVVVEEFLKQYVAFKAETNVVDVVPQRARLQLYLNMPFPDISDPRGSCRDVTGVGKWGNGDVGFWLSTPADVPYAVGLVRQALETQLGGAEDA